MINNTQIKELLANHGFQAVELAGAEGGSILALNAGARVLRLMSESGLDFFWLNDSFRDGDPEAVFRPDAWHNFGGDRTWIAPEIELFVSDMNDPFGTYRVPGSFDPGSYSISADGDGARISGSFEVTNFRLGCTAELSLDKTITSEPNPVGNGTGVEYIGYRQSTTLRLLSEIRSNLRFGLWHIAQLRATGDILIPVTNSDRPRDYFAPTGPDHLTMEEGLVRFRIDAAEMHKMAIKAAALTGRVGFIKNLEDGSGMLIVRDFHIDPSAMYVDVPWDDLDDFGYAFQCYNDDGNFADFGEMEYHAPAIGDSAGQTSHTDTSSLWAFKGDRERIREIAGLLLERVPSPVQ